MNPLPSRRRLMASYGSRGLALTRDHETTRTPEGRAPSGEPWGQTPCRAAGRLGGLTPLVPDVSDRMSIGTRHESWRGPRTVYCSYLLYMVKPKNGSSFC